MNVRKSEKTILAHIMAEPPSKRPANEEATSKLWGRLSEILSESAEMSGEDHDITVFHVKWKDTWQNHCLILQGENPFKWWAVNLKCYPLLSELAKKYLSAPPTSTASERVFSGAGIIHDDRRSRIFAELAEKLLLIRCNFSLVKPGSIE